MFLGSLTSWFQRSDPYAPGASSGSRTPHGVTPWPRQRSPISDCSDVTNDAVALKEGKKRENTGVQNKPLWFDGISLLFLSKSPRGYTLASPEVPIFPIAVKRSSFKRRLKTWNNIIVKTVVIWRNFWWIFKTKESLSDRKAGDLQTGDVPASNKISWTGQKLVTKSG